ncbi:hypothetical protein I7I48_04613 [Histoplasma ohiense]|nr:hypothetical protein I7I48_04613 [Histoplasma ohiense (nom. inval.)]
MNLQGHWTKKSFVWSFCLICNCHRRIISHAFDSGEAFKGMKQHLHFVTGLRLLLPHPLPQRIPVHRYPFSPAHIFRLSGAGEYIDTILQDFEENDCWRG